MSKNYTIKVAISGDKAVGKTALCSLLVDNIFTGEYKSTIGVELFILRLSENITLNLWDLSGDKRFESITNVYASNVKFHILMYDLTDQSSFDRLKILYNMYKKQNPKIPIIILGTHADKPNHFIPDTTFDNHYKISNKTGIGIQIVKKELLALSLSEEQEIESIDNIESKNLCLLQ